MVKLWDPSGPRWDAWHVEGEDEAYAPRRWDHYTSDEGTTEGMMIVFLAIWLFVCFLGFIVSLNWNESSTEDRRSARIDLKDKRKERRKERRGQRS